MAVVEGDDHATARRNPAEQLEHLVGVRGEDRDPGAVGRVLGDKARETPAAIDQLSEAESHLAAHHGLGVRKAALGPVEGVGEGVHAIS